MVTLTDRAAAKVADFLSDRPADELVFLRVAVQAGGCAGFRYALFFDGRELEGDQVAACGGVTVRVDASSAPYLEGATVDWVEALDHSGFTIDNPNASGSCACGESSSY